MELEFEKTNNNVFKHENKFFVLTKTIIVSMLISLVGVVGLSLLVGYNYMIVATGSMQPTLLVGSVIAVAPVDYDDLEVGDIITFTTKSGAEIYLTHRIHGIADNGEFITKGDYNDNVDASTVSEYQLVGKVVANSYELGQFIQILKSNTLLVISGILIFMLSYIIMW